MLFSDFFWDYDGTLVDSYPRITRAFQRGAASLGVELAQPQLMKLAKVSIRHMAATVAEKHGVSAKALMKAYTTQANAEGMKTLRLYEGVLSLLEGIVAHGGSNYLYTHNGNSVLSVLEYFGVRQLFTDTITGDDLFPEKPAPDALLYLIHKHGLDVSRCIMLGDRNIDVQCGLSAGMAGALFDPDGYYDYVHIQYRFKTMQAIQEAFFPGMDRS